MIAPPAMYLDQLRKYWKRIAAVSLGVALVTATIVTSGRPSWREFPAQFTYNLIISFCVGALFWLEGPLILSFTSKMRPAMRWAVRIVNAAIVLNVGVLI